VDALDFYLGAEALGNKTASTATQRLQNASRFSKNKQTWHAQWRLQNTAAANAFDLYIGSEWLSFDN